MTDLILSKLHRQLNSHNQLMNSGLVIQNVNQNSIRIDKFDTICQKKMFLKYTPIMFFLVSSESELVKLELITYNEEVFDIVDFAVESSEDLFDFVVAKFKNVSYSACSGIKKVNIRPEKLERYRNDEDSLFEKYGESFIFRSLNCRRIIENEASMDLCDNCKNWLLMKESNIEEPSLDDSNLEEAGYDESNLDELAEVKIKYEAPDSDSETVYGNEKPQSKRSPAWQHFTTLGAEKTAECIYCQKLVPTFNNTSGLLKHLQRHHKEVWSEMSLKKQAEKAVKSEATVPFTKRLKKKSSLVWQHFQQSETLLDTAECNLCQTGIACKNGNTTGMWLHMKRIHQQIKSIKTEDSSSAAQLAFNEDESWQDGLDDNNDIYDSIDPSNLLHVKHEIFGNDRDVEDGTALTSPTKTRSLVWNYFKKSIPAMSVCDLCGKDICTVGNNTSGMIKHLNCMHPEIGFKNMLLQEKLVKAAKKELERQEYQSQPPPASYPKSSPAWKYFTQSELDREISICNLCSAEISCVKRNTSGMLKHLLRWHPDTEIVMNKKQECNQCQRKFFFKNTLIKHLKIDHGTEYKKFKCIEDGCDIYFRLFKGKLMRRHLREVHGHEFNQKEGMFLCDQCDKKFKSYDVLQKHIKGVHESMHVPCYICAKLVKEGTPMEHHIKYVHLQPNKFQCDLPGCNFTTRHKDTLLDHQSLHTGTKRWCCGTCGKEHRLRSGLYLCEKTHEGYDSWQHVCDQCSKRFISKQKLVMHMRMHTGEKPFFCPVCRFRSARMSNLNAHIKKSHGLSWKEAEQQYGVSAKTGEMLVEEDKPGAHWENPHGAFPHNIHRGEDKFVNSDRDVDHSNSNAVQKSDYQGMLGHSMSQ